MFRLIHTSIWREDWFCALPAAGKLLFFYLLTNDYIQPTGFIPLTPEALSSETGVSLENLNSALANLDSRVVYFPGWGYWVKRFPKWQGKGKNWQQAIKSNLERLPFSIQCAYYKEYPDTPPEPPSDTPYQKNGNISNQVPGISNQESGTRNPLPPKGTVAAPTKTKDLEVAEATRVETDTARIFTVYSNAICMVTPMIADEIKDAMSLYSADWICEAIRQAVVNNKRSWAYCLAVLRNCKQEGRAPGTPKKEKEKENGTITGNIDAAKTKAEQDAIRKRAIESYRK